MKRLLNLLVSCAVLVGTATDARATLLIDFSPSFVSPDYNLLFNDPTLPNDATTVQGELNNAAETRLTITGSEALHTNGGQSSAAALDQTLFQSALYDALSATVYFSEFEANVDVFAEGNTVRVTAYDQFGNAYVGIAEGVDGQNFFGIKVLANSGEVIDKVLIETLTGYPPNQPPTGIENIENISQVRVSLTNRPPLDTAPEPTALLLLGAGLFGTAFAARRRTTR